MTLGMHFALTAADEKQLRSVDPERRFEVVSNDIEESYPEEWTCETDVFWNMIHRAFNDSELNYDFDRPLQGVIFGGEALTDNEEDLISLKTADDVKRIAEALSKLSEEEFSKAFFAIDPKAAGIEPDEDDFAICWECVTDLQAFYSRAAAAGRSVIFTVSQ